MLACRLVSLSRAHLCSRSSVYAASQQRSGQQVSYLWQIFSRLESPSLSSNMAQKYVDDKVAQNKVMVFSKSYCPYCKMAKDVLNEVGVKYGLVELDERDDCDAIQDYLKKITGARSVPRVFIGGKCIGGGSETRGLHDQGKLIPMLKECGAL